MTVTARKYNPGFLSDDELVASFCVRTSEFHSLIEVLRECTGSASQHQIVIGPQGQRQDESPAASGSRDTLGRRSLGALLPGRLRRRKL